MISNHQQRDREKRLREQLENVIKENFAETDVAVEDVLAKFGVIAEINNDNDT